VITALAALTSSAVSSYATARSLQDARRQLAVTEQGQVTERFGTATQQLGSSTVDVRFGAV
jgi:hypothetical protein